MRTKSTRTKSTRTKSMRGWAYHPLSSNSYSNYQPHPCSRVTLVAPWPTPPASRSVWPPSEPPLDARPDSPTASPMSSSSTIGSTPTCKWEDEKETSPFLFVKIVRYWKKQEYIVHSNSIPKQSKALRFLSFPAYLELKWVLFKSQVHALVIYQSFNWKKCSYQSPIHYLIK